MSAVWVLLGVALAASLALVAARARRGERGAQRGLSSAVEPVRLQLARLESEIGRLERERAGTQGELRAMVDALGEGVFRLNEQAGRLAGALRSPGSAGAWGEMQLRNVVELTGMVEYCDFRAQQSVATDAGVLRPDMVIRLPGERLVIVDAKAPLDSFLAASEADRDDLRAAHLERHARSLRSHVGRLASKSYQDTLARAADFVVLFVPSDAIYRSALDSDPALLEHATRRRVLIATPTTLIGLLWAIEQGWREQRTVEHAREIAQLARELHARLARFAAPFARVGRELDGAVAAYNEAVGSFDARLMPHARRLESAGAGSGREIPEPLRTDIRARRPESAGAPSPQA